MGLFFKQLKHKAESIIVSLDEGRYLLFLHSEKGEEACRLTKIQFAILSILFKEHPQLVTYEALKTKLHSHKVSLVDATRLHRKVSELRVHLKAFNPILEPFIQNLRGVGYHLSSDWFETKESRHSIKRIKGSPCAPTEARGETSALLLQESQEDPRPLPPPDLQRDLKELAQLMAQSIGLTRNGKLASIQQYCVMDRSPYEEELKTIQQTFFKIKRCILDAVDLEDRHVFKIRLNAFLEEFFTYLSLSRVSEYVVPHEQWCLWFEQDIQKAYEKIILTLQDVEAASKDHPPEHLPDALQGIAYN